VTGHPCPVCGYPDLEDPAWSQFNGSLEICPSCGIQFGYDDAAGGSIEGRKAIHLEWRKAWIASGMRWTSIGRSAPSRWNPAEQLRRAGLSGA